jgi:hypothetical protein
VPFSISSNTNGDETITDVSEKAHVADENPYDGLTSVDLNNHKVDLAVPKDLFDALEGAHRKFGDDIPPLT